MDIKTEFNFCREEKKSREVRKKASVDLVLNLQKIFAYLICSNRKYVDPSPVLKALVDDYGNQIAIGEQKDVGEFNIVFLARIAEALEHEEEKKSHSQIVRMATLGPESPLKNPQARSMLAYIASKGFINENFFGTFQIITRSVEKDGKPIMLNEDTEFGQININAMEKDIYQGWDTNYFNEIDDYRTPEVI